MEECKIFKGESYKIGKTTYRINVDFGENQNEELENLISFLIDYIESKENE